MDLDLRMHQSLSDWWILSQHQVKTSLVMLVSRLARCFDERRTVTSVELAVRESTGCSTRFFAQSKMTYWSESFNFRIKKKMSPLFGLVGKRGKRQMEHKGEICESRGDTFRKGKGWVRAWSFCLLLNGLKPQISGAAGQIFPKAGPWKDEKMKYAMCVTIQKAWHFTNDSNRPTATKHG